MRRRSLLNDDIYVYVNTGWDDSIALVGDGMTQANQDFTLTKWNQARYFNGTSLNYTDPKYDVNLKLQTVTYSLYQYKSYTFIELTLDNGKIYKDSIANGTSFPGQSKGEYYFTKTITAQQAGGNYFVKVRCYHNGSNGKTMSVYANQLGEEKLVKAQKIEYIENTSTSYINTSYKPNNNTRIVCEMQEVSNSHYGRLFGCAGGTAWNSTPLFQVDYEEYVTGNLRIIIGNDTSWNVISSVTGDYNKHTYEINKNKLYRDGTLLLTHSEVTYQCTTNLAIFSYMKTGGITTDADEFMKGRVYSFKIYDNGVVVRDFIPVRVGNVGYMYDKISKQLFGNSGSGNFILGADI